MTISINLDFGSKDFKIPGLESKFDFIGVPNSFVRCFEDELNRFETTVLYQLLRWHSWSNSGVVLREIKWIYKSVAEMIGDAFCGIKPGKLYRALQKLVQQGFLLKEQLHREHYGDVHACAAYNRRNYYSPVMERVIESITNTLAEQSPQTLETLGFSIIENQVCQNEKTDFLKQKNNTHTTSTSKLSPTLPFTLQGKKESDQEKTVSQISQAIKAEQEQSNSSTGEQKEIDSNTTPFATVVQRPPCVEQKINKNRSVQKPAQTKDVQEALEVEVMPPGRRQRKPKTRKGTQPNNDFGLAPWTSLEQFQRFYRALIKKLPLVANSRSPQGLAHQIINQLKKGVPHSYWDDFVNGLPIGTSTQQEWEVEPGVAHPMFIEYLAEKLIKGNNSQTREQAIATALDIASSPKQAIFFWKECKISLGHALDEAERHRALGVRALPTPLWTKERPVPTLEEAAIAGTKIALINSSTENALQAAQNRQLEGSIGQIEASTHEKSNTTNESDPWLDEVKPPQKPRISDFASEDFKRKMGLGEAEQTESKSESKKRYAQPDSGRRQPLRIEEMSFSSINKALLDPILREELTPQLMLSDYELITDEMGRILRIEKPPE
ncbi:MAG: hypothetical protein AAGE84_23000 [Cyanobacteria bacterium P01_G01_bin.39]